MLVNFKRVIQEKTARMSYRQEGGAKQHAISAYKMGASMGLFKLQILSLLKLPSSVSGDNWSVNEHWRATFVLKWVLTIRDENITELICKQFKKGNFVGNSI